MQPDLYVSNTPADPSDSFSKTQPQFLTNFQQLFDIFSVNHIPFNEPGQGNHTIIELLQQEKALQTGTSEISVYTKNVEGQTDQIFLRYQENGQEFQFTNYQIYALKPTTTQTSFFTFLPGKIIAYFGKFSNLPMNVLNLNPAVSKNIMTMTFCPIGTNPALSYKPKVSLQTKAGDFYKGIVVTRGVYGTIEAAPSYYLILGNL